MIAMSKRIPTAVGFGRFPSRSQHPIPQRSPCVTSEAMETRANETAFQGSNWLMWAMAHRFPARSH